MTENDFAEMESTAPETDGEDYDLDNWETRDLDADGETVVGELVAVLEDVGKYDARVYLLETDDGKEMVFGNGSIDAAFDRIEADTDEIESLGIRNTGETYENQYGEFTEYGVRYTA